MDLRVFKYLFEIASKDIEDRMQDDMMTLERIIMLDCAILLPLASNPLQGPLNMVYA